MAQGLNCVSQILSFQEQSLQCDDPSELTPIYTPDLKAYRCYFHTVTLLYARAGIHVYLVHHLSFPGRLSVYKVVREGWQLNVINTSVPVIDAAAPFLQALAKAYRQTAMLAPTIIIGNMNAAPTPADRSGQAPPHDSTVLDTIDMLELVDLTTNLEGKPSHFPHQTEAPLPGLTCATATPPRSSGQRPCTARSYTSTSPFPTFPPTHRRMRTTACHPP